MDHHSTITTASGHVFKSGDLISLTVRDTRWWRRVLHRLMLRRGHPQRTIQRRVSGVTSTTIKL